MPGPTLDSARRLDVRTVLRWLRRQPPPSYFAIVGWSDGGSIGASLAGHELILDYASGGVPVREEVRLESTPCTYGGSRTWVLCPNCGARGAVLYAARASGGRFFCRTCHGWPYGSTRERAPERAHRRARTIRARQGDVHAGLCASLRKPPYQRWATYARLSAEHDAAMMTFLDGVQERAERMAERLQKARR